MNAKLDNAKGLYLEGIRDGNVREAVTKYTGDRYKQHSTGVADGVEGFVAFFEPFVKRNPNRDIEVIRSIVDDKYVFVHVYQNINNGQAKWVTADIFDTDDNNKIIEHWDVIQAYEEKTISGRTMIDGAIEIVDLEKTKANKTLINNFFDDILIGGNITKTADYISRVKFEQHNPNIDDGLDSYNNYIKQNNKTAYLKYQNLHLLIGQGNFVVTLGHAVRDNDDYAIMDIFRVKDDLIVEHWDVQEKILSKDKWGNSGKF